MVSTYSEKGLARVESTGSIVEAAGGIAVIVLSIIGLTRFSAGALTPIAVIILGASLLAEGGAVATEYTRLLNLADGSTTANVEIGGGMTTEIIVGAGVLVLGILSLLGISPVTLTPVAVIAAGALLLISAPAVMRMSEIRQQAIGTSETAQSLTRASASSAAGFQVLSGLAAVVLGILSLTATGTDVTGMEGMYALIGLLVLGASLTFSGGTLTGNMLRVFNTAR